MAFELPYALCFLLLLLLMSFSTNAQTYKNISLGSSLTALNSNSYWTSPSGEFAFGFQKMSIHGFLLAIWFNKIPERSIVWSANGNNLVQKGSTVELTADGHFRLNDTVTGKQIWIADAAGTGTGVAYAAMLDTGNFVLANRKWINLWESFDQPTDTILPTQTLIQDSILFSRYTAANYSRGRFQLTLQPDGNLVLYTTNFPLDSPNFAYWSTQTFGSGNQVIFNQSGSIYLTAKNGTMLSMVSSNYTFSMQDFYQRATLEYNGVFRYYVYPKSTSSSVGTWPMAWSTLSLMPSNVCTSIREGTGGGACGFNSICRHDDQGPSCQCPVGYSFVDPNDELKGCKQDFVSQSCDEASLETDTFYFQEMQNTDWPYSEYEHFQPVTEDWCRQNCLDDCLCAVAIFKDNDCWKKRIPLSNGMIDPSAGGKALIKMRKDNSTSTPGGTNAKKKDTSTSILVGLLLSSLVFLNCWN